VENGSTPYGGADANGSYNDSGAKWQPRGEIPKSRPSTPNGAFLQPLIRAALMPLIRGAIKKLTESRRNSVQPTGLCGIRPPPLEPRFVPTNRPARILLSGRPAGTKPQLAPLAISEAQIHRVITLDALMTAEALSPTLQLQAFDLASSVDHRHYMSLVSRICRATWAVKIPCLPRKPPSIDEAQPLNVSRSGTGRPSCWSHQV